MDMRQPGTDYGERGETGEKLPEGAAKADTTGERKAKVTGGVGMGKADMKGSQEDGVGREGFGKHDGRTGEFKGGNKGESVVYTHKRLDHPQKH